MQVFIMGVDKCIITQTRQGAMDGIRGWFLFAGETPPSCDAAFHQIFLTTCFFTVRHILRLQVEADDYDGENSGASDTSNKSCGVNNGMPAVRQVNNFISDNFVTSDICRCF